MKRNKHITISYAILRIGLLLFWIYVGLEKLWQLAAFKISLEQQPIISLFAPVLYWVLPLVEISIGIALAIPSSSIQAWGWKASILLIGIFTIYIGLGVLNIYGQKPCMCSSFLSNITWSTHLLINMLLLVLSLLGKRLNRT